MLQIPFTQYPCYTKGFKLDNATYFFKLNWNTRGEFWTLTIYDVNKVEIISGIKLVLNYNLLKDYHHLAVPPGNLYVIDLSDNCAKIAYKDFTNERQLQLVYEELDDLATV